MGIGQLKMDIRLNRLITSFTFAMTLSAVLQAAEVESGILGANHPDSTSKALSAVNLADSTVVIDSKADDAGSPKVGEVMSIQKSVGGMASIGSNQIKLAMADGVYPGSKSTYRPGELYIQARADSKALREWGGSSPNTHDSETYVMLLAGLGLMAVIVRRRSRKHSH